MILIKLKRRSSQSKLTYVVVVASSKAAPSSNRFLDRIGFYKPITDHWSNKYLYIDFDRLQFWLERGAQMNKSLFILLRALLCFESLKRKEDNSSQSLK